MQARTNIIMSGIQAYWWSKQIGENTNHIQTNWKVCRLEPIRPDKLSNVLRNTGILMIQTDRRKHQSHSDQLESMQARTNIIMSGSKDPQMCFMVFGYQGIPAFSFKQLKFWTVPWAFRHVFLDPKNVICFKCVQMYAAFLYIESAARLRDICII